MIRVSNVKVDVDFDQKNLQTLVTELTGFENITSFKIIKKSIDARNKRAVHFLYTCVLVLQDDESLAVQKSTYPHLNLEVPPCPLAVPKYTRPLRPVIIGSGPAGLMAGILLAKSGANPLIIERGKPVSERQKDVNTFWVTGVLNSSSNVQFGEGGAGTFSDGKLATGIKKDALTTTVLNELILNGAPAEIAYLAKPHIGTDKLAIVVPNIRKQIQELGGSYRFETTFIDFKVKNGRIACVVVQTPTGEIEEIPTDCVILAIGHSARDTFEMLHRKNVLLLQKPFSIGARIEHLQSQINTAQYGTLNLGAADYKLAIHLPNGRSAYTFCMCPGGVVIAAASEQGHLVTNGMSTYARDQVNANSALLVGITPVDFGSDHPLAGMYFQRKIENAAFIAGGSTYQAPAQLVGDFLKNKASLCFNSVTPSYAPTACPNDLKECLPAYVIETMQAALVQMDRKIKGFACNDAVLTGVESRSSSPVRIVRDQNTFESASVKGLYPCGEGAGYAGGIMSAGVDGLRCAYACLGNFEI